MRDSFIRIRINGEIKEVASSLTLSQLLSSYQIDPQTVVVERNHQIVPRVQFKEIGVQSGDEIEVVHFVGGGKGGATKLVIVESPTKAKTLHKYLGDGYQIEASMGHVRDLPKSKMGVDLSDNFKPAYVISTKSKKTVSRIKKEAKGKEGIYLAPDPDREGEAISWHLSEILKEVTDSKIQRVTFNEITPEAVREAFHHPREIDDRLVNAQQARRILDRLVGYELSPLLWRKVGKGLSAGRVQSVALRLIVEREKEIKSFVPKEYWQLTAKLSSEKEETEKIFLAKFERIGEKKPEIGNQKEAEELKSAIEKLPFRVEKVEKRERQRKPSAPYTTSRLQQESYTRLGFTAAKTMKLAQRLYEGVELEANEAVGLITYMRTDSVNVSKGSQDEAAKWIREKFGADYLPDAPPVYKSKKGAQEAHEAIRPTSVLRLPEKVRPFLQDDEFRLYELIWRRFVSSQMMPAIDEQTSVTIVAGDQYFFKATGKRNLFPGFDAVFSSVTKTAGETEEDEEASEDNGKNQELPALKEGETLKLHELLPTQHFTKPPARFNDASLVRILEEKGIGRPSTYAPTIYTLLDRGYAERKGGALMPTELADIVVSLLVQHFPTILDYEFTALMEEELDKIEEGELEWHRVLKDFYVPFSKLLEEARNQMRNVRREVVPTDEVCDICGKQMVIRWGRFGQFLACSGFPECRYTKSLPTGFRCPQPDCKGDLVKRQAKNRRTFYGCSNYPKCTYIARKLPRDQETVSEDEKPPETDLE
ncbi:MAG: type I DNA topoisomerase [Candidatus Omnitrophica bacterium]|nr:type I DNA topoisomerase [Candidatus Omnitrophota bacterium]